MASWPTSVKTFTTKNTGDVIQATHINDVQDEVNAIEDGFFNGTARINSSNLSAVNSTFSQVTCVNLLATGSVNHLGTSTLANLSVTNSTIASITNVNLLATGSVNFTGTSTFASAVIASASIGIGGITFLQEVSTVAVPAAGAATLYLRDNGAGKTQLMCQFSSGVAQQVAIEP